MHLQCRSCGRVLQCRQRNKWQQPDICKY
ncbi:hypothetical protein NC651_007419 [Populus alba x Populus x berolinensis]|nr:hypothetical protein NC651_007419 [Populus alba x Populus x berolinensis]